MSTSAESPPDREGFSQTNDHDPTGLTASHEILRDMFLHLQAEMTGFERDSLAFSIRQQLARQHGVKLEEVPEPIPITESTWSELIDPGRPTIGIRPQNSLIDAPLFAQASQQMREEEDSVNIVILPFSVYGKELETDTGHYVSWGVLIDGEGNIHMGDFPEPLRIDALNGRGLASDPADYPFTLINKPGQEALLDDKERTKELLRHAGIPHIETLAVWHPGADVGELVAALRSHQ